MLVLSLGVAARGGGAEAVTSVTVKTELDRPVLVRGGGEQEVVIKVTVAGGKVTEVEGQRPPLNPGGGTGPQWVDDRSQD